ncbi:SGNH/GDSL hydrolase family protein [Nocardioides sp. SOB44]|uniref:SGNH/GDSL hydrolase family protein n=1 Tax=Nocardioides cremeus TaxID=3058044 RepID=A0ABT8TPS6_9ACTN|nr:SGNH/GDSL hydrolase family protein [Nocardioides cremeus]MDO3395948.1 SGNH/GDSL hydrolase family protein [Nocardioides cremeus]
MTTRPLALLGLLAPLVGALLVAPSAGSTQAAAPQERRLPAFTEYVALGDSWTADVVLVDRYGLPDTTHAPIDCAQSKVNYPKIVAEALDVPVFRDASCGSATTRDFRHPQEDLPLGGTNAPQFDRLSPTTDLVSVGIGGNDAGIAGAGLDCLNVIPVANPVSDTGPGLPFGGCKAKYTAGGEDQLAQRIRASEIKLVKALRQIRRRAPLARILVMDYLDVVPDHGCYPTLPATDEDMAYISAKFRQLNKMVHRAARRGGAEVVNTYRQSAGHDLCQAPQVRWAETYGPSVNDPAVGVPAHPNAAGARAQAAYLLEHLRETDPDVSR